MTCNAMPTQGIGSFATLAEFVGINSIKPKLEQRARLIEFVAKEDEAG